MDGAGSSLAELLEQQRELKLAEHDHVAGCHLHRRVWQTLGGAARGERSTAIGRAQVGKPGRGTRCLENGVCVRDASRRINKPDELGCGPLRVGAWVAPKDILRLERDDPLIGAAERP